ncbi:hypothetical protein B6A27_17240 [Anoxybacillus sp. UARK-01]|uniref:GGDEF domain-containing protein n=1 Tax=Anoxybacillus sp. UARK-01 TaxID=1895648 RepID=UPI0009BA6536|nr:GGDEF domain-containing protein [Anoxybacillus sp. UARK-01]OQM44350.1 hypothetical protein B6A27_17240 [Anoxybacillus sp. UARK-01]
MILFILANIGILLLMHLFIQALYLQNDEEKYFSANQVKWLHILIVSLATISLFDLLAINGGQNWNWQTLPLVILAMLHGTSYALPALCFVVAWRWILEGEGTFASILFEWMLPTFLSLLYYHFKLKKGFHYIQVFFLFSFIWLISQFPILHFSPFNGEVFQKETFIHFLSFQLGALLLLFFIHLGKKQLQLIRKLRFYADHDPLTHLYNMRKFVEVVNSQKQGPSYYIAMLDIDFFKRINDTYGHQNGDEVLKKLADMIKEFIPERIIVGRYGGEEFIICIMVYNEKEAVTLLENLRGAIAQHTFYTIDGTEMPHITVSIGLARLNRQTGIEKAIEQADQYLYIAKQIGRNRIVFQQPIIPS